LMMAAFAGIGTGFGGLAGGLIYDNLGARAMFVAVIFITTISLIIYCWGDGIQLARPSSNAPWNFVEGSSDDLRQISGVRTIMSVETVQNKKKPHRLLSWSDDDDDDEYRYA
ncbi:1264_t:CDS:2, partial [Paraglomus occultum]